MNRTTGQSITGLDHLRQSLGDILTTPIGSRVMRREYGSLVPELIDHPDNLATQVRVYAAVASALMRWEPRFRLTRIESLRQPDRPESATDIRRRIAAGAPWRALVPPAVAAYIDAHGLYRGPAFILPPR